MRLKRSSARAWVCALAWSAALSATAALSASPALALPEGRVLEMVSPPFKGGQEAIPQVAAPDGESVVFTSLGLFAGAPWNNKGSSMYVARRSAAGWSTAPAQPPPPFGTVVDFSADLRYAVATGFPEGYSSARFGSHEAEGGWLLHQLDTPDTAAAWPLAGGMVFKEVDESVANASFQEMGLFAASDDLCHLVLKINNFLVPPEAANAPDQQLYDFVRGCGGEGPGLSVVTVRNELGPNGEPAVISTHCSAEVGLGNVYADSGQVSHFHAISADGRTIFFTTNVESGSKPHCLSVYGGGGPHQLLVRLGAARTVEVSRPLSAPCGENEVPCKGAEKRPSAYFTGASEDGSHVYFTTVAPLATTDTDAQNDLYMATLGCPSGEAGCTTAERSVTSLVQVSHGLEPAEVQGVVRVAQDGSRVYFVAHGVLTAGANAEGQAPVKGADNMYVYDRTSGATAFIADLCSGPSQSGAADDARCPANLDTSRNDNGVFMEAPGSSFTHAQSTSDGRFLVFASFGQLTRDDTDTARDAYRYDAVTGTLERVSVGEGGADANGNDNAFNVTLTGGGLGDTGAPLRSYAQHELNSREMSEDGSRIIFESGGPLSPLATGGNYLYEWHKEPADTRGKVSFIAKVGADTGGFESHGWAVITPSGRDVFFQTSVGLVPQDTEGEPDIYDARLGGGFPEPPATRRECSGDSCQGSLSAPQPLLIPGSVSQAPGENLAPSIAPPAKAPPPGTRKCPRGTRRLHGRCTKVKRKGRTAGSGKHPDRRTAGRRR